MAFAAIAALAASMIGGLMASGDKQSAMAMAQQAADRITQMGLPPDQSKALIYQQLQVGGHLTPQLESALAEENFAPAQVTAGTQDTNNLMNTLNALKAQSQGGLTAEQMANQQKLLGQTNANTQAQLQGILRQQAEQGKSGSGSALASALSAIQSGAQNNSQNALQIGAQGSQAQASALSQLLSGQSNLRQQNLTLAEQNAARQQQADMFKAQNSSARQARNIASTNQANEYNLGRQNQVNDINTNMYNQEQIRRQQAQRQYWLDQLAQNQGVANALNGQASNVMGYANNTQQSWNNIGQGVAGIGAAYANKNNSNTNTPSGNTYNTYNNTPASTDSSQLTWNPDSQQYA
jgi:hypothetical protein